MLGSRGRQVDVEGMELAMLEGIPPARWGNIQQVVVEVHTEARKCAVETLLRDVGGFCEVHHSKAGAIEAAANFVVTARRFRE